MTKAEANEKLKELMKEHIKASKLLMEEIDRLGISSGGLDGDREFFNELYRKTWAKVEQLKKMVDDEST